MLSMEPRLAYGTNIAAWWGHLYDDFGKERITIYRIDAAAGSGPRRVRVRLHDDAALRAARHHRAARRRRPAARAGRTSWCRCGRTSAWAAWRRARPGGSTASRPASSAATSTTGASGRARRCTTRCSTRARSATSAIRTWPRATRELSGTAIEASANAVVQLTVRKDLRLTGPMLETPTHWIAHGFDEDLDRAMKSAARALLDVPGRAARAQPRRRLLADLGGGRLRRHAGRGPAPGRARHDRQELFVPRALSADGLRPGDPWRARGHRHRCGRGRSRDPRRAHRDHRPGVAGERAGDRRARARGGAGRGGRAHASGPRSGRHADRGRLRVGHGGGGVRRGHHDLRLRVAAEGRQPGRARSRRGRRRRRARPTWTTAFT